MICHKFKAGLLNQFLGRKVQINMYTKMSGFPGRKCQKILENKTRYKNILRDKEVEILISQ